MGHARLINHLRLRSALVRPLDRHYPTNLAVMLLAPAAGMVLAIASFRHTHHFQDALVASGRGALGAFGAWALAREVDPDDNAAAFVSMGLALLTLVMLPAAGLLPLFLAIMLARILNQSVGVPASPLDFLFAIVIAAWSGYSTGHPGPLLAAAAAFALDALVLPRNGPGKFFAPVALVGGMVQVVRGAGEPPGQTGHHWLDIAVPVTALAYALVILLTRRIRSVADRTGTPLAINRVRAAMAAAWLVGMHGVLRGGVATTILIWSTLAGVLAMTLFRPRTAGVAAGNAAR